MSESFISDVTFRRGFRYLRQRGSRLLRSDAGAAGSLNVALVTPFYTLLVCLLIELTLMLNVQLGVDYAAYAASRAAIVWLPAEITPLSTQEQLINMVRLAAVNALTPYASSLDRHRRSHGIAASAGDQDYVHAYRLLVTTSRLQDAAYITSKRRYAMAATRVEFDPPLPVLFERAGSGRQAVRVTVHYEMPFNTPGVGRILGRRASSGAGFVRDLSSSVVLELEQPETLNGSLGFLYDSRPL